MRCILSQPQMQLLQHGLAAQGYYCTQAGIMSISTQNAWDRYHKDRGIEAPNLSTVATVPEFTAK